MSISVCTLYIHVYSRVYDCIQTQRSEQTPLVYIATDSLGHNSHIQCVNLGACHDHLKWHTNDPFSIVGIQTFGGSQIFRLSKFQLFTRNKQKNSMTLSHIFQLSHSFIWCHVDLSYGVLWICFGSSVSSSAIIWCHVVTCGGATSILLALKWLKVQEILWWWTNREYLKVVKYRDREILRWWTDASI